MYYFRYNVAGVLGAILFVAVGFAALREADGLWDSWLFYLTLGFLLIAVLLAAHHTGDRRAFWVGFALFGWSYLSLALIPSTEPRLIATKALAHLNQSNIFGIRAYRVKAILALDHMRAHNVSSEDLLDVLRPSRIVASDDIMKDVEVLSVSTAQLDQETGQASQTVEYVMRWRAHLNKPEQYEDLILKVTPEGEILRLKDVAKFEIGSSYHINTPRVGAGTDENFIHIGHTLLALLAAWLGGMLSSRLRRISGTPEVLMDGK